MPGSFAESTSDRIVAKMTTCISGWMIIHNAPSLLRMKRTRSSFLIDERMKYR